MSKLLPPLLVLAAVAFGIGDVVGHYSKLPGQMASHFNAAGVPDGWSSKSEFVSLSFVAFAVVSVTFALVILLARSAPASLINLPNKHYWLAPERESDTRQALVEWSLWFLAATLWLLALIFHDAMNANLRQPPHLESAWWLLGGYLAVVVILMTQLLTRFRRVS